MPVDGLGPALHALRKSPINLITQVRRSILQIASAVAQYPASRARVHHIQSEQGEGSMSLLDITIDSRIHPLSVVEDIAASNDLAFERSGEDEITIIAKGRFADYQLSFTWMPEIDALHLACAFDLKIPEGRRAEVQRLVALVNEQLWVGHFDLWTQSGLVMYRQALLLPGGLQATSAQCEVMLEGAMHACERYFPAFQFVVWAGKSASDAMAAAMFDTAGEA